MRLLLATLCLGFCPASWGAQIKIERLIGTQASGRPIEVVAEQMLVRLSTEVSVAQRAAAVRALGGQVLSELGSVGWTLVSLPAGESVLTGLRQASAVSAILSAQPNHVYRPNRTPSDPLVPSQYALSQVNAFGAWEYGTGDQYLVTIAMIDAGIQGTHPDLSGKLAGTSQYCAPLGAACVSNNPPTPACNHGTRTAGVAAAASNNALGIAGMSWGAKLISLKVFDDASCDPAGDCPDSCFTDDPAIIRAIDHAVTLQGTAPHGQMVINMSVGGPGTCPGPCPGANCHQALLTSMQNAVAAGIPIVVSAGNDGGAVNVPAACATATGGTGIIPVGATDVSNNVAYFSSRGPELSANGVVAPGANVLTSDLGGGTAQASGTSFSAPYVSGLAALIMGAKPCAASATCAAEVQSIIRGGSEGIGISSLGLDAGGRPAGNTTGSGRMNAFRSMRLAVKGTLADFEGDQKAIAFPNPFRVAQSGNVSFTIPTSLQGASPQVKIYTMAGEFVRELVGLTWDGKNKEGQFVATGTYVFLVSTSAGKTRGRVAVIH